LEINVNKCFIVLSLLYFLQIYLFFSFTIYDISFEGAS